jgi:hypothetical protein
VYGALYRTNSNNQNYRGADKSSARPTSRCDLFDGENISFDASLVCIAVLTLDAGLVARSQYQEGPATGHLDTGFSWFHCVYKLMLRCFPSFKVATTCFSCSPPDLNFLVTFFFIFLYM